VLLSYYGCSFEIMESKSSIEELRVVIICDSEIEGR
jgi:hypothetical protein